MSEYGFRKAAKMIWNPQNPNSAESIKIGALLIIADSVSGLAENWQKLKTNADYYQQRALEAEARNVKKDRQIAGLRGAFRRLKNAKN